MDEGAETDAEEAGEEEESPSARSSQHLRRNRMNAFSGRFT
jgi:hypothetical protein